jgi:hypothetical protein
LGVAGLEITTNSQILLIAPCLTHIPLRKTYFVQIQPDNVVVRKIEQCWYVLRLNSRFFSTIVDTLNAILYH